MPHTQLNPNDPFWAHANFSGVGGNQQGCGMAIDGFPGLTPLGAWQSGRVQFGYRDLGQGRVFAVEADWQDNENSWQASSTALMGAMITW